MNKNYTHLVEEAIAIAENKAKEKGNGYVGTEHLLYAISSLEDGMAGKLLLEQGVTSSLIDSMIEPTKKFKKSKMEYSAKYNQTLTLCEEMRDETGIDFYGTEFVLLSLMKQKESRAVYILEALAKDFQVLFGNVMKIIDSQLENEEQDVFTTENNYLKLYGRNLNDLASLGKIGKVIGRENEINRLIQVLGRKNKNNPCIIGEAGVGKTAIVEGLAYSIVNGECPLSLKNKQIISLDLSSMIAGSKYRGEFEDRVKRVLQEAQDDPNIILFIDEIHTIIGAGSSEGTLDASNILKPVLARGEVRIIGATTIKEYRKYIEKDEALERRFQKILLEEPSIDDTIAILNGIKQSYEEFHNVDISKEIISYIVKMSGRYINSRCFPDKAIDLLDETCTYVKNLHNTKKSKNKEEVINNSNIEDFSKALKAIKNKGKKELKSEERITIQVEDVNKVLSKMTNIPIDEFSKDDISKLKNLEKELNKQIIGQSEAIKVLSKAVKRGRSGIKDPKKPIGSFLFLGPTGCGKTETCKALARLVFNSEDDIIRFDMSEYMEKHSVAKLIGSPPGYVGYEEGGLLTERVSKKPYSIVLFDEVEKAHPDIFNILLQVLDDGILTDSNGRKVDFKNTIIILTSNIGAKEYFSNKKLGFNSNDKETHEANKKDVIGEVKKVFNPEFINRLDEIVVFNKLNKENISLIADILIKQTLDRVKDKVSIKITKNLKDEIVKQGFSEEYGARPLKRAIQNLIENEIADYLIDNPQKHQTPISLDYKNNRVKINILK